MTNLSALFLLIASVAAATHATTFTTTTVYSKVLVALGQYEESSKDVEIIDLSSSETECQKLPNFPRGDFWVSGGLDFQEKPLLCGGNNNPSKCYTYEDGTWKIASSTNTPRTAAAITNFPSQDGGKKLLLTGGLYFSTYLSSTEVLTETGWLESAPMPAEIYVRLNSNSNL